MKLLKLLVFIGFVCAFSEKAFAQSEVVLKNYGASDSLMMLTDPTNNVSSKFISRINLPLTNVGTTAQELSMSASFGGILNNINNVPFGMRFFMDNLRPQGIGSLSNGIANIPMQNGFFNLNHGATLLASGSLNSGKLLGNVNSALIPASAFEPLFPFNTQKFIYYTADFEISSGSLKAPLCKKGKIIIRLVSSVNCVAVGKRCLLGSSMKLGYSSGYLSAFTAKIFDIHILKGDDKCGVKTPTFTPTKTPKKTNTPKFTPTKTPTRTPTKTKTPKIMPTNTPTRTPTKTKTPKFTATKTPTRTPTKTKTPKFTATKTPTRTPTRTPTKTATPSSTPTPAVLNLPVNPQINCFINNGDGTVRYYFGYFNQNPFEVSIPVGINTAQNKNILIVDSQTVSSQTGLFKPGSHKGEFSLQAPQSSQVIWVLQYSGLPTVMVTSNSQVPECQPVSPIAECVSFDGNGQYTAALGYENKNDFTIDIPLGQNNRISPDPANRGQPTSFLPGRFINVLNTQFSNVLDWFLGAEQATATTDSPLCSPSLECMDTDIRDTQFAADVASFELVKVINKLSRILAKTGRADDRNRAVALRKEAQALHKVTWDSVWSLPSIITNCADTTICAQVDNSSVINTLRSNSNTLFRLARNTAKRIRRSLGKRPREARLLDFAKRVNQENLRIINTIPATASVCN